MTTVQGTNGQSYQVEQGVPADYAQRGATTVAQYQQMAASDLSDRQIQAQRDIAAQQLQFNQQQVDAQQAQYQQQQQQAQDQAQRQTEYDTGRASQLADATSQIDSAFSQFYQPRSVTRVTGPAPGGPPPPMPTPPAETAGFPLNVTAGSDGNKIIGPLSQGQQDSAAAAQKYQADSAAAKTALLDPSHHPLTATDNYSDYFDQFAHDYVNRAQDDITRQQQIAERDLGFQLARQGISASQARANQEGLIQETSGRATAEQVDAAQNAADALRTNVANARQNLTAQVINAQSIGSPIAGSTEQDVGNALQTQRSAISGVSNTAGDTVASLNAVPVVNTLSNIFGSVLGSAGSFVQGANANAIMGQFNRGFGGTNPGGSSTRLS